MIKSKEQLELDLAHHEELADHWTWLAKRHGLDLPTMSKRIGRANHHAKLALEIQAEINNWK